MGNRERAITYAKRMLVDSIWKEANVEGLGTTFPNTEAVLNNLPVTTTSEEVCFILNMKRAWNFILDTLDVPCTLSFIREVNKICGEGLVYDCGTVRTFNVSISGTDWIPGIPYEPEVINVLEQINKIPEPVERAITIFEYLTKAQLFADGNKRVAQLMCNKVLIESGIGIMAIPVAKCSEFRELLVYYYETDNSVNLTNFIRKKCIQYLQPNTPTLKDWCQVQHLDYDKEVKCIKNVMPNVYNDYSDDIVKNVENFWAHSTEIRRKYGCDFA